MPAKAKARPAPTATAVAPTKAKSKPVATAADPPPLPENWLQPPLTLAERLERIQVLSQRIESYVRYIGNVDQMNGTSAEAKNKAVINFYERLLFLERDLGRIQEDLRLG